jgi:peroxiredoxin
MARQPIPVVVLLSLVLFLGFRGCAPGEPHSPFAGIWRIEMAHPGGPLPFNLEVSADGREAWLLNPPERLMVEEVRQEGGKLILAFPSYGSRLELAAADGGLTGKAYLIRRDGPVELALTGSAGTHRFVAAPHAGFDPSGSWTVDVGGVSLQQGLGQFAVDGGRVTGSVQLPSGDTRFLAGEVDGDTVRLSTFDGNSTALWIGRLRGDTLAGERWAATSTVATQWTARRGATTQGDFVSVERPESLVRLGFAFPDASGRTISLADPQFAGKVVVIAIGGAWCPNCHDEARFLAERARALGGDVAFLGLQFEYGEDPARAFAQLDRFARRYDLPYPLLLAGQPTAESTRAALPEIGGVRVYPTTLFVGRDGLLREVHVGWAGPATGPLHEAAKRRFNETVARLLAESA